MKRFDQINVIPMIDVMLVLLAIVLTSASFIVQDKLNIDLPETQQTSTYKPDDKTALRIAINADNQFFLNDQTTTLATLSLALENVSPEDPIEIRVDQKAEFGHFTSLIDLMKQYHLSNLNILTRKQNG
ncbi:biopolymer transporter ExbD [Hydrogenovibrio sp. 3SP14C1]|uniref:ExbD/TolR family protein n=1 Tax=Hydrogenovibrio sp. 3SP14C1 TaxID=3038774 RepID=UPI0024173152|nr:biopolymer transporter ExbD [Hydrogenovibrio sp. 3SP14C1]MDG4812190.1 biopolymer transporter ExbD [Hydrogenovibrio sp. 3SP14C1]